MATIGNTVASASFTYVTDRLYIFDNTSGFTYTPAVNEEVYEFYVYMDLRVSSATARLAIYDITSGAGAGSFVGEIAISAGPTSNAWESHLYDTDGGTPLQLVAGTPYSFAFLSNDGWIGRTGNYNSGSVLSQSGQLNFPATLNTGTTSNNPLAGYALTRVSGVAPSLTITDVNGGNAVADGDSVVITTTNAEAIQGTGSVIIALQNDINSTDGVAQTITSWSDTSIGITVSLPVGASTLDAAHFFVTNDNGDSNSSSYTVGISDGTYTDTYTASFGDLSVDVICSSSDFSLGMTAYMNKDTVTEEIASSILSVSAANTSDPQYSIAFTKAPVFGSDTITIVYDQTVGDIVSVTGGNALLSQEFIGMVC